MREHGESFDHNLHALRIVEHFEQRYASHPGLNLTFEVREGIIKHSHDYSPADYPELAEYLLDQRPPLEAQLIDQTDEIAYNTADLDDGYEAHLLKLGDIRREVAIFDRYFRQVEREFSRRPRQAQVQRGAQANVEPPGHRPDRKHPPPAARASGVQTVDDIRRHPERLAAFSPATDRGARPSSSSSSFRTSTTANRCARRRPTGKRSSATFSAIGWSIPPAFRLAISSRWKPRAGLA